MSESKLTEYKSPRSKLVRFFETSRNAWKAKCKAAKKTIKALNIRIRDIKISREKWKIRALALEKELAQLKKQEVLESKQEGEKKTVN